MVAVVNMNAVFDTSIQNSTFKPSNRHTEWSGTERGSMIFESQHLLASPTNFKTRRYAIPITTSGILAVLQKQIAKDRYIHSQSRTRNVQRPARYGHGQTLSSQPDTVTDRHCLANQIRSRTDIV